MLLAKIAEAASCGVDFIQLRERDLSTRELTALAQEAMRVIRENRANRTQLLINSRTDVAIAIGAAGVHLRSMDISPTDVREIWNRTAKSPTERAIVSVACHKLEEVALAARNGADFALLGPVFEKRPRNAESQNPPIAGLNLLRRACRERIPVIALGGITQDNARDCHDEGAPGVAAIRLFQENSIAQVMGKLRDA